MSFDPKEYDFGGWATKNDLKCADGRTIRDGAFKDNDGVIVPLVWQHQYNGPANILGHALLQYRPGEGMYTYGKFNDTEDGRIAKKLVEHKDIRNLSIFANHLTQTPEKDVLHGQIREVSLVLAGANPGAYIDFPVLEHSDGTTDLIEEEATIYNDEEISLLHEEMEDKTVQDVLDTLNEEQKAAVGYVLGSLMDNAEEKVEHSDEEDARKSL